MAAKKTTRSASKAVKRKTATKKVAKRKSPAKKTATKARPKAKKLTSKGLKKVRGGVTALGASLNLGTAI